jgi:predicted HAD superfamily Cof-like phosphohydrolase
MKEVMDKMSAIDFIKTLVVTGVKTNFEKVKEFHKVFGVLVEEKPTIPEWPIARLRINLIDEEAAEVALALAREEVAEIGKELADLLYVVLGTAVAYGIDMDKVFDAVHKSNMSKVNKDGSISRRKDGKVLKGNQYEPPDLSFLKVDA